MLNLRNSGTDGKRTVPSFAPTGDFKKKLRWHIGEGAHAEFWTISPADAEEMLKRNVDDDYRNRPMNKHQISAYARAMANGRWFVTGEPVTFSGDGVLLNGQHRLSGCIQSGRSFTTLVVFGIDREAFKFMDQGLRRSASNVFAISGITNFSLMAAAALWVYRLKEVGGGLSIPADARPENDQLLEYFYRHDGLQESAWVGHLVASEGESLISNSLMTALHYLFARKSKADADDFMRKVVTGVGIVSKTQPEHILRKWLLKDNAEVGGRTRDPIRAAYVVQAWNARRQGKKLSIFRWRTAQSPNAPFPTIR